jgi:serine/threonine-protein kinase
MRAKERPWREVLDVFLQAGAGLSAAHKADIIHRDFKPDNVIVQRGRDGLETARIVDFGIALLRDDASPAERERLTTAGVVLGTPHYMAPEHASGKAIDHRIDLFALGVICFEMLTGRLPFDGDGVEVARANMMFDTPPMRAYVPHLELDPLLEAFTRKLLKRSLDERIGSAREARALLDLIERDRGAAAAALGFARSPAAVPARPMLAMPIVTPIRGRATNTLQPESSTSTVIDDRDTIQTRPRSIPNRYVIAATIATAVVLAGVVALRGRTRISTTPAAVAQIQPLPAPAIATVVPDAGIETVPIVEVLPPAPPKVVARIAKQAPTTIPPVPMPPPPSNPTSLTPSAAELAQLYAAVGRKLSALERAQGQDATLDLWPRYRNIRIQAVLVDADDRSDAAVRLLEIERAIDDAMRDAP